MYNPRSEGTRSLVAILWRSVSVAGRAIQLPLSPLGAAFDESPGAHVVSHNVIQSWNDVSHQRRLDAETLRALAQLEATGLSRSEAIRRAILDSAARLQRRAALAAEVAALEADEEDRRDMLEVAALMEIMRAAG